LEVLPKEEIITPESIADEPEAESKTEQASTPKAAPAKKEKKKSSGLTAMISVIAGVLGVVLAVGLFMFLPNMLGDYLANLTPWPLVLGSVFAGIFRIIILVVYMALVSLMKDIRRTFEYHGAEHKTIATYESGAELTVENARKHSRLHPRCGTSFLLIVMVVSIVIFSFLKWGSMWQNMLYRLLLMPVVAGISYEMIKFAGKSKNRCVAVMTKPGLWLQKVTTREPDDSQLEVAIASLKAVLTDNKEDDKW
jgi:uncharacterized protein YqhQ